MDALDDSDIAVIESALRMEAGYVLDFSNRTFTAFFARFGTNIYDDKYAVLGTSKANRLRAYLQAAPTASVADVLEALLERRVNLASSLSAKEAEAYRAIVLGLRTSAGVPTDAAAEALASQIARILMLSGDAVPVALLASAKTLSLGWASSGFNDDSLCLRVGLPDKLYLSFSDDDRRRASKRMVEAARPLRMEDGDWLGSVVFDLLVTPAAGWREDAVAFLRGEGINNQGRVRSDNLPSRQEDGLLFRSVPEIHVYKALKSLGVVTFAPLPVFLRGDRESGRTRRIEPDFIIYREGAVMLLEVDGDTVHHETPAEADRRTTMFGDEGAFIRHVRAEDCDTPDKAHTTVVAALKSFKSWRDAR
jgi:hypothetical protein